MRVSIVVINHNGKEFLRQCLAALEKYRPADSEVIVVDDASSDGSADMVQKEFPQFKIIQHQKNRGPAAARNTGAGEAEGKYLVFLDGDTIIRKGAIQNLVFFFENKDKAGIVGAKIYSDAGEPMWWNFGYPKSIWRPVFLGEWLARRGLKKIASFFVLHYVDRSKPRQVGWVVESLFLMPRELFEKMGGFDENFFMFHEGPDLCERVRKAGYEVWYAPRAEADNLPHHTHTKNRRRYFWCSEFYYHKKHSSFITNFILRIIDFFR